MKSDKYYGVNATEYEARRSHKASWKNEQDAVEVLVTAGPVLDCPVGTGRYIPIYNSKGLDFVGIDISSDMLAEARKKHPDAMLQIGSIFDIPYPDKYFETAVCSRLLNWLYPEQMEAAVAELRRVANSIVVSVRTGPELESKTGGNYTHDISRFYRTLDGLYIADRRPLGIGESTKSEMFLARKPQWSDVDEQFKWHAGRKNGNLPVINNLANSWTARFRIEPVDLSQGVVKAEFWSSVELGELIDYMASIPRVDGKRNRMLTNAPPRFEDFPLIMFRSQGHTAMIDGRRRANKWRNVPGLYPALVVEV